MAWVKEHCLKRINFWLTKAKQKDSWIWKSILSLRPLAKSLLGCEIGNGHSASYWFDRWSLFGPLIDYIGEDGPTRLGIPVEATVAQATIA